MSVLPLFVRLLISLLLVIGAVGKSLNFGRFCKVLEDYRLLPRVLVIPMAFAVCLTEFFIGIGLIVFPRATLPGVGAAFLFTVFSFAISVNLMRGNSQIDCGCLANGSVISWSLVTRNLLLSAGALVSVNALKPAMLFVVASGCPMLTQMILMRRKFN